MPSLDVVSRVDHAEIDNAINNTKKHLSQRFDFRTAKYELSFDKKAKKLHIVAEDTMKLEAVRETFASNAVRRGLDVKCFDFGESLPGPAGAVKREVKVREGLEGEMAKKVTKLIKESGLKLQASILGDEVRLSGKKIDDLRAAMALLSGAGLDVPLQYVNMKS